MMIWWAVFATAVREKACQRKIFANRIVWPREDVIWAQSSPVSHWSELKNKTHDDAAISIYHTFAESLLSISLHTYSTTLLYKKSEKRKKTLSSWQATTNKTQPQSNIAWIMSAAQFAISSKEKTGSTCSMASFMNQNMKFVPREVIQECVLKSMETTWLSRITLNTTQCFSHELAKLTLSNNLDWKCMFYKKGIVSKSCIRMKLLLKKKWCWSIIARKLKRSRQKRAIRGLHRGSLQGRHTWGHEMIDVLANTNSFCFITILLIVHRIAT